MRNGQPHLVSSEIRTVRPAKNRTTDCGPPKNQKKGKEKTVTTKQIDKQEQRPTGLSDRGRVTVDVDGLRITAIHTQIIIVVKVVERVFNQYPLQ